MSSFALMTDIDGKIIRCFYDDTDLRLNTRLGDSLDDAFGSAAIMDLQVFLDMVREKGIPDNLAINAPVAKEEMYFFSGVRWNEHLLVTGISYPVNAAQEVVSVVKQTNLQQLVMTRSLLETNHVAAVKSDGESVPENKKVQEQVLEYERKNQQLNLERNLHLRQMPLLSRMNSALQMCNNLDEIYKVVGIFTEKLFSSNGGSLFIFRPEVNKFEVRVRWGEGEDRKSLGLAEESFIEVLNLQNSQRKITGFLQEGTTDDLLLLRIPEDTAMVGVLQIKLKRRISTSDPFFAQFQQTFLRVIGLAIKNMQYRQWLQNDAMVDHLTNMYNRRFLTLQLDRELSRAMRQGSFLSLVMLDLDEFKGINETYGHLTGDQYLIEFGKLLQRSVRKEDYACRYGGDEFALILVESNQEDAIMILDRIKAECKHVLVSERTVSMPFSSGVSTFPTDGRSSIDILKRADEVLYLMKRRKRTGSLKRR